MEQSKNTFFISRTVIYTWHHPGCGSEFCRSYF